MPFVTNLSFCASENYIFFSFDGENYQSMESSKFSHLFTYGLENYTVKELYCKGNYTVKEKPLSPDVITDI